MLRLVAWIDGVFVLDAPKKVQLHRNRRNLGNHTLFVTDWQNAEADPIAVDAVRLDDAVEGAADFVKIDAEGSEQNILAVIRANPGKHST